MQYSVFVGKVRHRLGRLDWSLIRGSAIITVGTTLARLLAMAYWLILARALTPEGYGFAQYVITLGTLAAILTHPLGQHVFARYIGKHRDDPEQLAQVLSNLTALLIGVFVLSVAVTVPILIVIERLNLGVLMTFFGITLYYIYWGIASGFQAPGRLMAVTLGSNLLQLVATYALIEGFGVHDPQALVIYGLAYVPVVVGAQLLRPLPVRLALGYVRRAVLSEVLRFSWPIWLSHISFTIGLSLPILMLEHYAGSTAVGIFSLANTLTALFGVVSLGLTTLLMPKIAGMPRERHLGMLMRSLVVLMVINGLTLIAYVPLVQWFIPLAFDTAYLSSASTYFFLALVAILAGVNGLFTAVLVGGGQVRLEAAGRTLNLLVTALAGWLLVPSYGVEGAATAMFVGTLVSILLYIAMIGYSALRERRTAGQKAKEHSDAGAVLHPNPQEPGADPAARSHDQAQQPISNGGYQP
jgi:O-antigen/teichoic acid export membrane protein